jgi:hypothetical protein
MENHPHSYGLGLSAIGATAAPVGGFPLLAVLVYVADEYPAFEAGAETLKAGVVRLYGVVIVVMRVYPSRVHSYSSFLWAGLRGVSSTSGAILLYPTTSF